MCNDQQVAQQIAQSKAQFLQGQAAQSIPLTAAQHLKQAAYHVDEAQRIIDRVK